MRSDRSKDSKQWSQVLYGRDCLIFMEIKKKIIQTTDMYCSLIKVLLKFIL